MDPTLPCELISWSQFGRLARRLALKIHAAGFQPDLIIAIARGGYAPARVMADYFNVMNVASIKVEHYRGPRQAQQAVVRHPLPDNVSGQRVLIVDDVSDTGDTFEAAIPHIRARLPGAQIRTAVLLHKAACPQVPDFYARKVLKWRWIIYPWAVVEDLSAFLDAADETVSDVDAFAHLLAVKHRLRVPRQTLADVLSLAGRESGSEGKGVGYNPPAS